MYSYYAKYLEHAIETIDSKSEESEEIEEIGYRVIDLKEIAKRMRIKYAEYCGTPEK